MSNPTDALKFNPSNSVFSKDVDMAVNTVSLYWMVNSSPSTVSALVTIMGMDTVPPTKATVSGIEAV